MARSIIQRAFCYVIPYDSGFAPNPFHGICTLTTCKPEIRLGVARRILAADNKSMSFKWGNGLSEPKTLPGSEFIRAQGIWVIGIASNGISENIERGSNARILYLMQVTDVMSYEEYWQAHPEKRPIALPMEYKFDSTPQEIDYSPLGDNVYESELAAPLYSPHYKHGQETTPETINQISKDRRGTYSLLSDNFAYFGNQAIDNPLAFPLAVKQGRPVYERGINQKHPRMPVDDDTILNQLDECLSGQLDLLNLPGRVGFPAEVRKYRSN